MPEPNPILGVHVVPGGCAWASVLRLPDGAFRVLAWGTSSTPGETLPTLGAAAEVLRRRAFRRRGAFVALPDSSGCLVSAVLPPDELHLEGEDLRRELCESTPFEPGAASLRHRPAGGDGRRREHLVAALPTAQEQQEVAALGRAADETVGLGFATACTLRGARAAGLAPAQGFLVEIAARATTVLALDGERVRRYLVACGRDDLLRQRDPAARAAVAQALAADVLSATAYHRAQRPASDERPEEVPPPEISCVGVALAAPEVRNAVAAALGVDAVRAEPRWPAQSSVSWVQEPGAALPCVAGAVGAALEAFAPAEERLALRPPPTEVPEARGRAGWVVAAGVAAGLALVAAGSNFWRTRGNGGDTRDVESAGGAERNEEDRRTLLRAAHVAAWRDALASVGQALDDGEAASRAARRVTLEPAPDGTAWDVEAEVMVRGGEDAVARAIRDLGEDLGRRVPTARPGAVPPVRARGGVACVVAQWRIPARAPQSSDDEIARALAVWSRRDRPPPRSGESPVDAAVALSSAALLAGDTLPSRTLLEALPRGRVRVVLGAAWTPPEATLALCRRDELLDSLDRDLGTAPFASEEDTDPGLDVRVEATGPGAVRVSAPAAWRARSLERRGPGEGASWVRVAAHGGAEDGGTAIDLRDEVPGPSGEYAWRTRTAEGAESAPAVLRVEVPVDVTLLGRGAGDAARLALSRTYAGTTHRVVAEWKPGERVVASVPASDACPEVTLDPGETLVLVREVDEVRTERAMLPTYLQDGRVRRGDDGAPFLEERAAQRHVRMLEAVLRAGDGTLRSVSGKMTDG